MIKEIDIEGHDTLDVISKADRFNRWMYDTISPYCQGKILEIGSGIGNISQFFIAENKPISLSDVRENYCSILSNKYSKNKVIQLDLVDADFEIKYQTLLNSFDTVFALNVIEHIENDSLAIQNCKKLLKKNGRLIILVPAYAFLFNEFDKSLEHFRRYNKNSLNRLVVQNQLIPIKSFYFNCVGILGWFVSGNLLKNKTIPEGQMGLYNKLVPLIKLIDKIVLNKIGLSVITFSKKS
ncbi:MAG: class I SAM-dependent methyltransferase [Flavobacteriaceae bacterium]|nr:class I SAM-dependent methyltransferase [Flavobacteriaceae bacterium]